MTNSASLLQIHVKIKTGNEQKNPEREDNQVDDLYMGYMGELDTCRVTDSGSHHHSMKS